MLFNLLHKIHIFKSVKSKCDSNRKYEVFLHCFAKHKIALWIRKDAAIKEATVAIVVRLQFRFGR